MDLHTKLKILGAAAKYDVSCSSSGSSRRNRPGGLGNASLPGICHSWSDDGRCISLLKILFTNRCAFNCLYCVNRATADVPRATFTPDEVAQLTINFYKRNYIEGLFLSSAVYKNPNYTMELLITTVRKLRNEYHFNGYIHLKAIPGADPLLIAEAGKYVDRMSVNIELPSSQGLQLLAPQKNRDAIIKPMGFIHSKILQAREERKLYKNAPLFVPAGQTTQLIVGATPDNDLRILRLSESLYKRFSLKRVYYSAYVPVTQHPNLPAIASPPLMREHRLYQADWLLRFYGFKADELLDENQPLLDIEIDPKSAWALRNLHLFPVEVNRADYEMLLRVPGIGVRSAKRIIAARRYSSIDFETLKRFGVVLKRARHFITCRGKFYGERNINESALYQMLKPASTQQKAISSTGEQLTFSSLYPHVFQPEDVYTVITGEM
ncbi:putative DNA modification/repair radical SAM protein [Caldicoprobacter algeriensis]|uniref:putative DNA modification/repair radical SAM protein n=1 Tax=Caldicoprobacter algeriensis TaxID=699281 RepID=UPI00207A91C5|nr:putative DNA modification/repair radical SAM protein [Caldicoprobacter algeriensis]MCM8899625.1 putative DNA modification/repair radical SAM protein [Caldicoprobacter algeriensis]